jgi:hypothetical protein
VLNNFRKHRAREAAGAYRIDPYSSAPYFDGFRDLHGRAPSDLPRSAALPLVPRGVPPPTRDDEVPILAAKTWFAQVGWRRAGLIALSERPATV